MKKSIIGVKAAGYGLIVEMLPENDITSSALIIPGANKDSNQAYIMSVGSMLDEKYGFKAGQRVMLQGTFNPAPNPTNNGRNWAVVQVHDIKAILEEDMTAVSACCQI